MLFAGTDLAARIERAACQMVIDCADAIRRSTAGADVVVMPVGSGVAAFGGVGSPINKIAGLGFDAAAPGGSSFESQIEAVETAWSARGAPVQVELSCLADPGVGELLTKRGYTLRGFENVLGCALPRAASSSAGPRPPDESIKVTRSRAENLDEWIDVMVTGFATPDTQGLPSHESYPREVIEPVIRSTASARGFSHFIARRSGVIAGGASLRIFDGIAHLCGAATIPEHRRRGVQSALLDTRLETAARAGCGLALVTTQPGSKSQQNAQVRGFELLYARAVLVREMGS